MTALQTALLTALLTALPTAAQTQALESRVARIGNGTVSFHFVARPVVCGDGEHFIRTGPSTYHGSFSTGRPMERCVFGPVQVRLTVEDGVVNRVQTWVGPLRDRAERDLGGVGTLEAARFLVTVAERGSARASEKAILPAVLADSAVVWPALLRIARDTDTRSRATRRDALHWLSRFAAGAIVGRPNDPFVEHESGRDDDLKSHAVFVLSQLRGGDGISDLLEVARTNRDPHVRAQALFWLGQSGDARAIDLFESVLRS